MFWHLQRKGVGGSFVSNQMKVALRVVNLFGFSLLTFICVCLLTAFDLKYVHILYLSYRFSKTNPSVTDWERGKVSWNIMDKCCMWSVHLLDLLFIAHIRFVTVFHICAKTEATFLNLFLQFVAGEIFLFWITLGDLTSICIFQEMYCIYYINIHLMETMCVIC